MRALVFLTFLLLPPPASAWEIYAEPASSFAEQCRVYLDPPAPQDFTDENDWFAIVNDAGWCGRAVFDWLHDTGRADGVDADPVSDGYQMSEAMEDAANCGAQLILQARPEATVAAVLEAQFDDACPLGTVKLQSYDATGDFAAPPQAFSSLPPLYGTPETCAMHAEGKLLGFLEQHLWVEGEGPSPIIFLTLDDGDSLCAPVAYEDLDGNGQMASTEPAWECGTAEFDLRFMERCE